jgi:hypothetical protein
LIETDGQDWELYHSKKKLYNQSSESKDDFFNSKEKLK